MSSYTWSSSRQFLRIASLPLSGHHLIDLLMNFLWLPDTYRAKPMLHKLVPIYLYFLSPGDKQHQVVSFDHLLWARHCSLYTTLSPTNIWPYAQEKYGMCTINCHITSFFSLDNLLPSLLILYVHHFMNPYKWDLCMTVISISQVWRISLRKASDLSMNHTFIKVMLRCKPKPNLLH